MLDKYDLAAYERIRQHDPQYAGNIILNLTGCNFCQAMGISDCPENKESCTAYIDNYLKAYGNNAAKKLIRQEIVHRAHHMNNNAETIWEHFDTFICRVSKIASNLAQCGKIINISYPDENTAIITYSVPK